ncbi:helix-turn-helix domain-containing protein [Paenibacillus eucommiae]|uniref:AraC-like DNA-binding protein n=1 Tax=Paenibacillus eucommiae TaxID=1355755 RepID=A0ABS4IUZ8_9BACL|nr:helix-turn-helix domain-containing protein [Paenibacillus eucommiae]MBP1991400.1 AraC-like DNA-binding protein [Paenibacillus eucommiae]
MVFKWRKAQRSKNLPTNFYAKLIFYIVMIAILPILIVSTLSYLNVKKALESEMKTWNQYVLENSKNALELNFNQILYQAGYLITNNITNEYESVYNSIDYENMAVSSFKQDLNGLNEYLFFKKNMIKMMSSIKMNNKYIDDIYFFDKEKDMILNSEGHQYNKTSFYDQDVYQIQENSKAIFSRMDIRTLNSGGIYKNIVTLVYRTLNKNNTFVVNINISALFNSTISSLSIPHNDHFIYSKEANKLISSSDQGNELILEEMGGVDQLIASAEKDRILKDHYLVSWVKSERLGWYVFNVKDLRSYYNNLEKARNLVLLSSSLLLLLFLVLSSFVLNRIYSPFKKLILETFNIQNKLNENTPVLQRLFKYEWIKGTSYSQEEVERKANELNCVLPKPDLFVLLVQCEDGNNKDMQEAFDSLLLSRLQGFCLDIDGQLACVVHMPKEEIKQLDMLVQAVKDEVSMRLGIPVAVGVGRACSSLTELNRAYIEAAEALKYRFVYGNDEIIFFEDIKLSSQKHISYPVEKEKALRNCIMTGNTEDAQNILKKIIDELTESQNALSSAKLHQSFQMLMSGILKTVDMLGIEIEDIFGPQTNYFETVSSSLNKEQLYLKYSALIEEIMKYVSTEKTNKSSKDMSKIIAFIEGNYDKDISLVDAADVVGLNPSYVSRLIKNHTTKSFTDYVTEKRMSEAEHLLKTTSSKLDTISQQVGYQNTYYFIKVFRKHYGTTPARFRQAYAESIHTQSGEISLD